MGRAVPSGYCGAQPWGPHWSLAGRARASLGRGGTGPDRWACARTPERLARRSRLPVPGTASRYPVPPADGSRTRCSSGGDRRASQTCPPHTSGALEHRPGQRGACPGPSAASGSGAASPRSARAEMHFLEGQEAARHGTRLAALPRQMCARGCLNHVCSRDRPSLRSVLRERSRHVPPELLRGPASRRVQLVPFPARGEPRPAQPHRAPVFGSRTRTRVPRSGAGSTPLPDSGGRAGQRGQPGQGQNVLRAVAGQHWAHARRAAGLCPPRRAGPAPALSPPRGSSRPGLRRALLGADHSPRQPPRRSGKGSGGAVMRGVSWEL